MHALCHMITKMFGSIKSQIIDNEGEHAGIATWDLRKPNRVEKVTTSLFSSTRQYMIPKRFRAATRAAKVERQS